MKNTLLLVIVALIVGCASKPAVNHPMVCHIDYAPLDKYASEYIKRPNDKGVTTTYEVSEWRCVKCFRAYFATNAVSFR